MVYEEVIPTTEGRISSPNKKPQTQSLDTLMTQIHQPPRDPRLHACVRSSELCSSPLSTAFALLTADGSVYAWGHPETMAARKRWNTKQGISYRSAVQRNGWAHICWLYQYFKLDGNLGIVFARSFFEDGFNLANIDSVMTSSGWEDVWASCSPP